MRIAQVAPLNYCVCCEGSDSTHRLIHHLTESLVGWGHEVTLFATGDSRTTARLEPVWPTPVQSQRLVEAPVTLLLERAFFSTQSFDLIHSHLDVIAFPYARRCQSPVLTTIHAASDSPWLGYAYQEFHELPLVSLMDAQRRPLRGANWAATIYPGLPLDSHAFHPRPGRYLAFFDCMCPDTAPLQAVQLAKEVGLPLLMAGRIDPAYREYFALQIEPLLGGPEVAYIGDITGGEKESFLGNALALLAPSRHASSEHLSFIEALACGTPIIAMASNSHAELIQHGITGYICMTYREIVQAIEKIAQLDRCHCRDTFEANFSLERMVQDYLAVYEKVIGNTWTLAGQS